MEEQASKVVACSEPEVEMASVELHPYNPNTEGNNQRGQSPDADA